MFSNLKDYTKHYSSEIDQLKVCQWHRWAYKNETKQVKLRLKCHMIYEEEKLNLSLPDSSAISLILLENQPIIIGFSQYTLVSIKSITEWSQLYYSDHKSQVWAQMKWGTLSFLITYKNS